VYFNLPYTNTAAAKTTSNSASDAELETEPEHNLSMPTQVDWRTVLCEFLCTPSSTKDKVLIETLNDYKRRLHDAERHAVEQTACVVAIEEEPKYETIHRVRCSDDGGTELFLDPPWTVNSGPFGAHLRGSNEIEHLELHLERNKQLSFIVYKDYRCCRRNHDLKTNSAASTEKNYATSLMVGESVCIISEAFSAALEEIENITEGTIPYPVFDTNSELISPYLWWYHQRESIMEAVTHLDPEVQVHIRLFQEYIMSSIGKEYEEVDQLFTSGQMKQDYMEYLFVCPFLE
jgi:hypothetical protein